MTSFAFCRPLKIKKCFSINSLLLHRKIFAEFVILNSYDESWYDNDDSFYIWLVNLMFLSLRAFKHLLLFVSYSKRISRYAEHVPSPFLYSALPIFLFSMLIDFMDFLRKVWWKLVFKFCDIVIINRNRLVILEWLVFSWFVY